MGTPAQAEAVSEDSKESLFRSRLVPPHVRYGLPVLMALDDALILYSNFTLGAAVRVRLQLGRTYELEQTLYSVNLHHSIVDMWEAKAYYMAGLIAIFSGVWPHLKLVATMTCWFVPPRCLSSEKTRGVLWWTYTLQKFSHIETFVLVIMMVAFSFDLELKTQRHDMSVRTYVRPAPGFFCFLCGLILSMIISRLALVYSKKSFPPKRHPLPKRRLLKHEARLGSTGSWTCAEMAAAYALVASAALLVAGLIIPSYRFQFKGLAGLALTDLAGQDSTRSSSVVSLAMGVPRASDDPSGAGVLFLQAAFVAFNIAAPLLFLVTGLSSILLLQLKSAASTAAVRVFVSVSEVLYAWSAIDVLLISMLASTLEMRLFVQFVIGDRCDKLNRILQEYIDHALHGDDVCFDLATNLEQGSALLGGAVILFFLFGYITLCLAHRRLECVQGRDLAEDSDDMESTVGGKLWIGSMQDISETTQEPLLSSVQTRLK